MGISYHAVSLAAIGAFSVFMFVRFVPLIWKILWSLGFAAAALIWKILWNLAIGLAIAAVAVVAPFAVMSAIGWLGFGANGIADNTEGRDEKEESSFISRNSNVANENETDSGYWLQSDRDYRIMQTERTCFYCCPDGKVHPLEHFTCYPCCGHYICLGCMRENSTACGECITALPYNTNAMLWIKDRLQQPSSPCNDRDKQMHLLGRICITGCHTYLDELVHIPIYQRLPLTNQMLAIMNPPNVSLGVMYLTSAAKNGVIAAMLDLADTYSTTFYNDPFEKDGVKAEYWFRRALGQGNQVFPLAFTRYGLFLKSEGRKSEAMNLFEVAATYGHARGQYELACLLLDENESEDVDYKNKHNVVDENKAIEWLCKASEKGFYVPSYLQLASILIRVAESYYGSAKIVGKSPLPRALQILSLIEEGIYGSSAEVEEHANVLLERYESKKQCQNCGVNGSDNNPLMTCAGCGVVSFCSKVCQKRCFRDGHRLDCCSREQLFDFHWIKLTLPWARDPQRIDRGSLPTLISSKRRTLMEMVEDDTDEVYGEGDLEYDEHITVQLMLRMRNNMETYLGRNLGEVKSSPPAENSDTDPVTDLRKINLFNRIDLLGKKDAHVSEEFTNAMHKIRELGNHATHRSPDDAKLDQNECEKAVREYRRLMEEYEMKKARIQSAPVISPVILVQEDTSAGEKPKPKSKPKGKKKQKKKKKN